METSQLAAGIMSTATLSMSLLGGETKWAVASFPITHLHLQMGDSTQPRILLRPSTQIG